MKATFTTLLVSLAFLLGVLNTSFSQIGNEEEAEIIPQKWAIELRAGMMNPISPLSDGASSSFSANFLNHVGFGFRYMFNDTVGLRMSGYLDNFKGSDPQEFHSRFLSGSIQAIADIGKYLRITAPETNFNLKGYLGIWVARQTVLHDVPDLILFQTRTNHVARHTVLHDVSSPNTAGQPAKNSSENDGGLKFGILPEFSLGKNFLLSFDLNLDVSFRRHMSWDGLSWDGEVVNKLTGTKWNFSIGFVYKLD